MASFLNYRLHTYVKFTLGVLLGIFCVRHFDFQYAKSEKYQELELPKYINFGNRSVERLVADDLFKKVRIFAVIFTMPSSKITKAIHVKVTWGKRFNGFMFISSEEDPILPSIKAVDVESREVLWEKTRQAFFYMYKNLSSDYDFFMKADDDSYVIVENLRFILSKYRPDEPFIMGRRFSSYVKQGYFSGGAGYVISRAALKLIVEGMRDNGTNSCQSRGGPEDLNLGACAQDVGVKVIDSLDENGQEAFHPFDVPYMMDKKAMEHTKWIWKYNYHPIKVGFECCSDHSVSFHYIKPHFMYVLDYLIYNLHPYGITRDVEQYNKLLKLKTFNGKN